jgi:hypothetical protein
MSIKTIVPISFIDQEPGGNAIAIVRQADDRIGLALSLEDDGDIEVFLDSASARQLAEALASKPEEYNAP